MADREKAVRAYEDFTGRKPTHQRTSKLDDSNVTGWEMGPMVGVAYEATRDGERKQYFHEFKKSARPRLVARDDGRKLYIDGGRYKVTERGIEDMPLLMTMNPSPRKRKGSKPMARRATSRRRRRTSQVAIFKANPSRRRRSPARRARSRRRSYFSNPAPRRRSTRRRVMRRNPSSRRRRSYRRNPSGGAVQFGKMFLPAAGIGLGAIGAEVIMGYLPIPANLKTGVMREVTKGVVGIAAGLAIGKLLKQKRLGNFIALGAVVIAVHDGFKTYLAGKLPNVQGLQGMGYMRTMPGLNGMGYVNPASTVRLGYMPTQPGLNAAFPIMNPVAAETSFQA